MRKISLETQRENAIDILNFLNTQGSDLQYLNGEDTLFTALFSAPVTQQMKLLYVMGIRTEWIGQTSPIVNKLITLYGEGGTTIGTFQILVLDATINDKVMVKNLTTEDLQTGFTKGHAVDQ